MSDVTVKEELFPFECGNSDCRTVYDVDGFFNVALLWGYICLASEKENLIGITCPNCHKTTVNKYKLPIKFLLPDDSDQVGKFRDPMGDIHLFKNQVIVPFSPKILGKYAEHLDLDIPKITTEGITKFTLPAKIRINPLSRVIVPGNASNWFVGENQIEELCLFERDTGFKVIPRINHGACLYSFTDIWLGQTSFASLNGIDENAGEGDILDIPDPTPIMNIEYVFSQFTHKGKYAEYLFKSNLTDEELLAIEISPFIDNAGRPEINDHIRGFLRDYHIARNRLDFEISFRPKFFDEHVKKIFAVHNDSTEDEYHEANFAQTVAVAQYEIQDLIGKPDEKERTKGRLAVNELPGEKPSQNNKHYFKSAGPIWRVKYGTEEGGSSLFHVGSLKSSLPAMR